LALCIAFACLVITCALGTALFIGMGISPTKGLSMFFVNLLKVFMPCLNCSVKATSLLLIALGLSVCFKSNIWNIGAEGQFVMGGICRRLR
jgi:simple sugar transport system permease protein